MKKYELKKSIRFKLNPKQIPNLETQIQNLRDSKIALSEFIEEIDRFISLFEQFVFQKKDNKQASQKAENNKQIKNHYQNKYNNIDINYTWLRNHTTEDFFDWPKSNNNTKRYFIKDIPYLKKSLEHFIDEWKKIYESLKKVEEAKVESKKRHSETSFLIQKFSKKQIFNFAKDFIQYANPKDNETIKNKLIKSFREVENLLPNIQKKYLPSQTTGICLAKASFNYYTINKQPRNYDEEMKKIDEKLKKSPLKALNSSELKNMIKKWMLKNPSHLKEIELNDKIKLESLNLKQSYALIKLYKSKAKSSFNEYIQKNINNCNSYEKAKKEYPLFTSKIEEYKKFVDQTKKIEKNNNQINRKLNNKLKSERKVLKNKRGKFFQHCAKNYKNLCKEYEKIAKEFGQNKAKKWAIEREKQESQMLNYWSFILEENNKYELILIPLKNRNEVKNCLESLEKKTQEFSQERVRLYLFYSLTLRGLKKLCFSNNGNNDFLTVVKKEIPDYINIKGEWSFQEDQNKIEEKIIEFYQKVLKTQHSQTVLDLKYFQNLNNVLDQKFQNISDFESALEKTCYTKKNILIDKQKMNKLLKHYDACRFEISSYDLLEHTKPIQFKAHTKIWKEFWTEKNEKNGYPVRLNPEISLLWRTAKYNPDKDKVSNKKSRWSQAQWTLKNSFTLNAGSQKTVFSFNKDQDIKNHIEQFNKDFNNNMQGKQIFCYGLDRGQKEKASLCILKQNPAGENSYSFAPVKIYKFKPENYSQKLPSESLMIKNLSKIIEKEYLFEVEEKYAFDLTTAKLINGKIVENGDIFTYLKLQEMSAKRKVFKLKDEIISENNGEKKIYISGDKKTLYVKTNNRNKKKENIYFWNKHYQSILSIEEIKKDIQSYLDQISQNNSEEMINKINHLREALAGNVVGILNFLHKKNTKNKESQSMIVLEKNQGNRKHDDDISIALEKALYNKFQTEGLAPPSLSHRRLENIIFQEQNKKFLNKNKSKEANQKNKESNEQATKLSQIGAIVFIPEKDTSKNCPYCEETSPKDDNLKRNQHRFICKPSNSNKKSCGFDTYYFKDEKERAENYTTLVNQKNYKEDFNIFKYINDPDKIAAFNIAKKKLKEI